MSSKDMALKVIANSRYNEFPDIVATIQLAMCFARNELRPVNEAMRECARQVLKRAQNDHLRRTLLEMSKSTNPNNELTNLIICNLKMRDELAKELKGKKVTESDLSALRKL